MKNQGNASTPDQFHFYYSEKKIYQSILKGLAVIAFFSIIFLATHPAWKLEAPLARIPSADLGLWLLFMVIPLWWFIYRPLRQLPKISTPVVTLSRDGIALKGRTAIPWHAIQGAQIASIGYGGIAVFSALRIWTSSDTFPKTILSDTLEISQDEYEKQCRIYSSILV